MMRSTRTGLSILPILLLLQLGAWAQGPYRYLVQVQDLGTPYHEKMVTDMMRTNHPLTAFRVDLDAGTIEIGTAQEIDRAQLTAELSSWGLTLTAMYRQDRRNGFHRWMAVLPGRGPVPSGVHESSDPYPGDPSLAEDPVPSEDLTKAGQ